MRYTLRAAADPECPYCNGTGIFHDIFCVCIVDQPIHYHLYRFMELEGIITWNVSGRNAIAPTQGKVSTAAR
jgi:hypothetical protein